MTDGLFMPRAESEHNDIEALRSASRLQTAEIYHLREYCRELEGRLCVVEDMLPPILPNRILCAKSAMSALECQIFHTPDLRPRSNKSVWSLKLQVEIKGRRAKPDVNVALYPAEQFKRQVQSAFSPDRVKYTADKMGEDAWAGMIRLPTSGKGTPYQRSQYCVLLGHLGDQPEPEVVVVIDDAEFVFPMFRDGAGSRKGKARWYAKALA